MGRFREAAEESAEEQGIDISPLIDCVFILLIFFIVTTVFVEESGVEVEKPLAMTAEQLAKNSILIAITPAGEVIYGGRNIGVAGVRGIVKRFNAKEDVPVIIQADISSPSGTVVRVIDEAKLAGAKTVSLSANQPAG